MRWCVEARVRHDDWHIRTFPSAPNASSAAAACHSIQRQHATLQGASAQLPDAASSAGFIL